MISDSKSFIDTDPGKHFNPFTKFSIPLYLIRAHAAKYILMTFKKFDDVKDTYIQFLRKYNSIQAGSESIESNQLLYLIENKVNVEKSIMKGKREGHKSRLLILIFLFNVAIKDGLISQIDKTYLDNIYKELGISYEVYKNIRAKYIKEKGTGFDYDDPFGQSKKLRQACKTLMIPEKSSIKEVKGAYRTLAKQYHPDVYKDKDEKSIAYAEEKFQEITEAYEYLKDYYK